MFKSSDDSLDCRFQKAGFLMKLPFATKGRWQKRWFVLKDGYMLYYGSFKKSTEKFDQHPRGAVPLGNCTIEYFDDAPKIPKGYYAFRATHPNFGGGAMTLACSGKEERDEWMAIMRDCRRITYENALLGDGMIKKLNSKGSELEAEQEAAMKEFEANALRHREEREAFEDAKTKMDDAHKEVASIDKALQEKASKAKETEEEHAQMMKEMDAYEEAAKRLDEENNRIVEEQARLAQEKEDAEAQLVGVAEEAATMEEQRIEAEQKREEQKAKATEDQAKLEKQMGELLKAKEGLEARLEKEAVKHKKAEIKLKMAQDSVRRLDSALKLSGASLDDKLSNDVKNLMGFFEKQVSDLKHQVDHAENVKIGLRQHKQYRKKARQLSVAHPSQLNK